MKIEELATYEELVKARLVSAEHVPLPEISRCFVARNDDGRIVGYCFVQPIVVVEPIWVESQARGNGVALKLFDAAVDSLKQGTAQEFTCHAGTEEVASYLQRLGLEETGQRVFRLDLRTVAAGGG